MEKMNNLRDLLKHEIQDLYSAEEQILDALPAMIDKAGNPTLKSSLKEHLRITELQKNRLDKVLQLMEVSKEEVNGNKKKGILGLFSGKQKCKGMEGIIEEAKKVMGEDMHPDVMDAAIIASAQKVEHYEICGYGTARSFAAELGLSQVADLLEETLDEEYELLGLMNEKQRQEYLKRHLAKVIPMVAEMEHLKEKVKLNGHFKNLEGFDLNV